MSSRSDGEVAMDHQDLAQLLIFRGKHGRCRGNGRLV